MSDIKTTTIPRIIRSLDEIEDRRHSLLTELDADDHVIYMTEPEVNTKVSDHAAITTSIHGIPDTTQTLSKIIENKKRWEIGDALFHSNDLEVSVPSGTSWTKKKEIKINELAPDEATFRLKFDMMESGGAGSDSGVRIYRNGTAHGAVHGAENLDTWYTKTEDLVFAKGDLIQLYMYCNVTDRTVYAKNFRVYGSVVDMTAEFAILYDTVGTTNGCVLENTLE